MRVALGLAAGWAVSLFAYWGVFCGGVMGKHCLERLGVSVPVETLIILMGLGLSGVGAGMAGACVAVPILRRPALVAAALMTPVVWTGVGGGAGTPEWALSVVVTVLGVALGAEAVYWVWQVRERKLDAGTRRPDELPPSPMATDDELDLA